MTDIIYGRDASNNCIFHIKAVEIDGKIRIYDVVADKILQTDESIEFGGTRYTVREGQHSGSEFVINKAMLGDK